MCLVRKFLDSGIALSEIRKLPPSSQSITQRELYARGVFTPMSRIIASINDVGYTTQAYSLVPRFLTAIEAVVRS